MGQHSRMGGEVVSGWGGSQVIPSAAVPGEASRRSLARGDRAPPDGRDPVGQMIGFRICDAVLHAGDLACSIGADDRLHDMLVEAVRERLSPPAPVIGQMGIFGAGPSGTVREDAPLRERLLAPTGRRPRPAGLERRRDARRELRKLPPNLLCSRPVTEWLPSHSSNQTAMPSNRFDNAGHKRKQA